MGLTITEKIIREHLLEGSPVPGAEVAVRVDQTLTPDSTGTMVCLQFEAMGVPRVRTELSVSYVDHQTLSVGFENADDHRYLQDVAAKYGIRFSRAGNGICHQVHLERFGIPGKLLLGADSHTPTAGALGMLAIGAGGLDVALAMAGRPFVFSMPAVVQVRLVGELCRWVSAKDVILELLRRLSCEGNVGVVVEYGGPGVATLSVPERGTIANMGAELGVTTSVFPSDGQTLAFLEAQGRAADFRRLAADPDADYPRTVEIDLAALEPMVALPHLPDRVVPVREVAGLPLDQVFIGSCTNSSFGDLSKAAGILRGRTVAPKTSLAVAPGSRQVFGMIARSGALADLIGAGARILESACGPCVGVGQAPCSGGVSLRTTNRNFEGRSGTKDAKLYLASVETAAASALEGVLTDPRTLGEMVAVPPPVPVEPDDRMIVRPLADGTSLAVRRGPNIVPLPPFPPPADGAAGPVLLKVGDQITTDHILPAGAKVLPLRSNIPAISRFCFAPIDPTFHDRARAAGGGFVVAGANYGQGSSREHAAICPRFLGVHAILAQSFARIHRDNLINMGVVPLLFADAADRERIAQGDRIEIDGLFAAIADGELEIAVVGQDGSRSVIRVLLPLRDREREILKAGGALNHAGGRR